MTTLAGYAVRPTAKHFMRHPVRSYRAMRFRNGVKEAIASPATLGVGVAALAVPVGLWLGRRLNGG